MSGFRTAEVAKVGEGEGSRGRARNRKWSKVRSEKGEGRDSVSTFQEL